MDAASNDNIMRYHEKIFIAQPSVVSFLTVLSLVNVFDLGNINFYIEIG
jgi:hypothetical protein